MNRRSFLAAAAAALAYDPERELWVPGAKTISVPAPREIAQVGPLSMYGPFTRYDFVWTIDEVVPCEVVASRSAAPTLVEGVRYTLVEGVRYTLGVRRR